MSEKDLIPRGRIDPARLSRENYAESLAEEAVRAGLLEEGDLDRIRADLMNVLAEVIGYKTGGQSTNIGTDCAKTLAESILYNVGTALRQEETPDAAALALKNGSMSDLYARGYSINKKRWEEARLLWGKVRYAEQAGADPEYDKALNRNIRNYLEQYDPRTSAHDRLYLVLPQMGIRGAFHIGGTVSLLKKLLAAASSASSREGAGDAPVSAAFREAEESPRS